MRNILLFGVNDVGSNIAYVILKNTDYRITVVDTLDPRRIYNHVEIGYLKKTSDKIEPRLSFIHTSEMDVESMLDELYQLSEIDRYDCAILANSENNSNYIYKNPNWTSFVNIDYPVKILDSLRRLSKFDEKSRLIHMSHWSVYGEQDVKKLPFKEDLPLNPVGLRGAQRSAQEQIVKGMCNQYGIKYIIFRLGTLCGPCTESINLLNTFCKNVILEETIMIDGKGTQSRDLVMAEDVGKVVLTAINKPEVHNEILNLGGNDSINISRTQIQDSEKTIKKIANSVNGFLKIMHPNPQFRIIERTLNPLDKEAGLRIMLDNRKTKQVLGEIPETKEADMIKKSALYLATYVLMLDSDKFDRLKITLNQMTPSMSSEANIEMYERRYNVSRHEKSLKKKV